MVTAPPKRAGGGRSGADRGYALLLALFVTLIATAAMMLGVAALGVQFREARAEAAGIRLDAMVDAAIAETLAHRHLLRVARRPFEGGWIESRVERRPGGRAVVTAHAALDGRVRGAEVQVVVTASGRRVLGWRVLGWRPADAGSARFGSAAQDPDAAP